MKAIRAIAFFMSLLLVAIDPGNALGAEGKAVLRGMYLNDEE